jgi:hypothetical protein
MNTHRFTFPLLVGMLLISSGSAPACGDKFLLLGRSIRYEEAYAAKHPASVLVYQNRTTGFSKVGPEVFTILKKAGHRPVAVEGPAALREALNAGSYDVVLADIADIEGVDVEVAASKASNPHAIVLPVVYNPTGKELEAAEKQYQCLLQAKGKDRYFLAVVNEVVRTRAKGKELKCKKA